MALSFGSPPVPGPHALGPGVAFPVHRPGARRVGALFLSPQTLAESLAERGSRQAGVQSECVCSWYRDAGTRRDSTKL